MQENSRYEWKMQSYRHVFLNFKVILRLFLFFQPSRKASMIHKLLCNVKKVTMDRTAFPHVDIQTSGESVNSSVTVLSLDVTTSKAVDTRQVSKLFRKIVR